VPLSVPLAVRAVALLLLGWGPLQLALRASAGLAALDVRGWPLGLFLLAHLVVTAVGFAAGRALLDHGAGAKRFALVAIALAAIIDAIYYGTTIFPAGLPPGDGLFYLAVTLAIDAAAIAVLARSGYGPSGSGLR
jgi:hypothetical protein